MNITSTYILKNFTIIIVSFLNNICKSKYNSLFNSSFNIL